MNIELKILDEVIETLAIIFIRVRLGFLDININKKSEYACSLYETDYTDYSTYNYNWEILQEISTSDPEDYDKELFREVAIHFLKDILKYSFIENFKNKIFEYNHRIESEYKLNYNQYKINTFVYLIKVHRLFPFYIKLCKEGDDLYNEEFNDLPKSKGKVSQNYINRISDLLINVYLINIKDKFYDEIIESLSIFFYKVHFSLLIGIDISKDKELEIWNNSINSKRKGNLNWRYLRDKSNRKNQVSKKFFRGIAKYFMNNTINFPLPHPKSIYL